MYRLVLIAELKLHVGVPTGCGGLFSLWLALRWLAQPGRLVNGMANANGKKKAELEDFPVSFKSPVWDHFGFPLKYKKEKDEWTRQKQCVNIVL